MSLWETPVFTLISYSAVLVLSSNVVPLPGNETGTQSPLTTPHEFGEQRKALTPTPILTPTPDVTIRLFRLTDDAALLRSSSVLLYESSQSPPASCSAAGDRCSQTTTSDDTFRRLPPLPPTDLADVLLPVTRGRFDFNECLMFQLWYYGECDESPNAQAFSETARSIINASTPRRRASSTRDPAAPGGDAFFIPSCCSRSRDIAPVTQPDSLTNVVTLKVVTIHAPEVPLCADFNRPEAPKPPHDRHRWEGEYPFQTFSGWPCSTTFLIAFLLVPCAPGHKLLLLQFLPMAGATRSAMRQHALTAEHAPDNLVGMLRSKTGPVDVIRDFIFHSLLSGQGDWGDLARRVWSLTPDPGTTGDYNLAARPASAVAMADAIDTLEVRSVLWVGCGHAPEALLWVVRSGILGRSVKVLAIEVTKQAVERARVLLRLLYMAYNDVSAETAAALDLDSPITFGTSTITIRHQDMFHYDSETMPVLDQVELILSAAGLDAMDDQSMRLCWLLMAAASMTATGLLMMYRSMWGRRELDMPKAADDVEIKLEGSGELRRFVTYNLKGRPMFIQYSTSESRESLTPPGWYWARVGDLENGTRVAAYWPDDNLFYPGAIVRRSMDTTLDHEIGVRYDDPDCPIEVVGPNERLLVHGVEDVFADLVDDELVGGTSSSGGACSSALDLALSAHPIGAQVRESNSSTTSQTLGAVQAIVGAVRRTHDQHGAVCTSAEQSHQRESHTETLARIADGTLEMPRGIKFIGTANHKDGRGRSTLTRKPWQASYSTDGARTLLGTYIGSYATMGEAVAARDVAEANLPPELTLELYSSDVLKKFRIQRIQDAEKYLDACRETSRDPARQEMLPRYHEGVALILSPDPRSSTGYSGVTKLDKRQTKQYRAKLGQVVCGDGYFDTALDAAVAYARERESRPGSLWAQQRREQQGGAAADKPPQRRNEVTKRKLLAQGVKYEPGMAALGLSSVTEKREGKPAAEARMRNQEEMTLSAALVITPAAGRVEKPPALPPSSHLDAVNIPTTRHRARTLLASIKRIRNGERMRVSRASRPRARASSAHRLSPCGQQVPHDGHCRRARTPTTSPISVSEAATRMSTSVSPETSLPRTRSALSAVRALLHVRGSRPWMRSSSRSPRSVQAREYYCPSSQRRSWHMSSRGSRTSHATTRSCSA